MPAISLLLTGVDIYVGGHVHDYERMYDMYRGQSAGRTLDMRATTYITTGSPQESFCGPACRLLR